MIRSGVRVCSVQREAWDEHAASVLGPLVDTGTPQMFELLSINYTSLALVRNVRGCIWVGAYAGRGIVEFVLHVLSRGFSCIVFTRHVRAAFRVFAGLFSDAQRDPTDPTRFAFYFAAVT